MLGQNCIVVSPDVFDDLFYKDALIAEFASESDEHAYERRDSFLIYLINQVVQQTFNPEDLDSLFVGDNWWPNHTRYIEAALDQCSPQFLTALRALLTNDFAAYRIQICVYVSLSDPGEYIGSMALYADRLVIESKLLDALSPKENA